MELKIDPAELMTAALSRVFAESDPAALAEAMASTVLKKNSYGNKTVLEEIIELAVKSLAREVVVEILNEHKDEFKAKIKVQLEDTAFNTAVTLLLEKLTKGF